MHPNKTSSYEWQRVGPDVARMRVLDGWIYIVREPADPALGDPSLRCFCAPVFAPDALSPIGIEQALGRISGVIVRFFEPRASISNEKSAQTVRRMLAEQLVGVGVELIETVRAVACAVASRFGGR
jgi:hypothetical protein